MLNSTASVQLQSAQATRQHRTKQEKKTKKKQLVKVVCI
jgi:hypothetical protein